jgi:hypothetical protein
MSDAGMATTIRAWNAYDASHTRFGDQAAADTDDGFAIHLGGSASLK